MKKKIEKGTIVRTGVLVFALANQALTISGHNPLPFSEDEVGQAVAWVLTTAASVWAWWKNNSFTQAALAGDEVMHRYK